MSSTPTFPPAPPQGYEPPPSPGQYPPPAPPYPGYTTGPYQQPSGQYQQYPGQYQQPFAPYRQYPPVANQQSTNGMAIASMVLGIVWLYGVGSILALIFGYISRKQIAASGGRQKGSGMAMAGIVLGWIGCATLTLIIILAIASAGANSGS